MTSYGVVTTGKLDAKSAVTSQLRIEHDEKDFLAEFAYVNPVNIAATRGRWTG